MQKTLSLIAIMMVAFSPFAWAEDEAITMPDTVDAVVVETVGESSPVIEMVAEVQSPVDVSVSPASESSEETLLDISQTNEDVSFADTDTTVLHDETPAIDDETIDSPTEHMPTEEDVLMPIVGDVQDLQATETVDTPILEEKPDETILSDTDTRTISVVGSTVTIERK